MSDEPVCPVCGEVLDDFGCLGEFRGKHVAAERARLERRVAELEKDLRNAQRARDTARGEYELLRQRAGELVKEWKDAAGGIYELAESDKVNEAEHRGRAESYEECAEDLEKRVKP